VEHRGIERGYVVEEEAAKERRDAEISLFNQHTHRKKAH